MHVGKRIIFIFFTLLIVIILVWKLTKNYSNKLTSVTHHLDEISGIEFDKAGNLWAINDSGNSTEIHQIDTLGNIIRSINISNAKNIDWEDLTQNRYGHFFIGGFGNNKNKRNDLTVYKIENPIDIKGNVAIAEIIRFKYQDQDHSKQHDSIKNFDLEAFVAYKGALYLFTKNRTKPFNGFTNLYKIGNYASNHKAKMISRFKTCKSGKYQCWITSAAISPNRKKLALLGSNKIWIFKNWKNDDFFSGDVKEIDLGIITQKEAITFANDSLVIIADEKFKGIGGNLYEIELN